MERNMELDRLRAIAALMTLYMHYQQVFYPWSFTLEYHGPKSFRRPEKRHPAAARAGDEIFAPAMSPRPST
jgi:peptidoglycan/LPS O-acetylase OafA/YrhL